MDEASAAKRIKTVPLLEGWTLLVDVYEREHPELTREHPVDPTVIGWMKLYLDTISPDGGLPPSQQRGPEWDRRRQWHQSFADRLTDDLLTRGKQLLTHATLDAEISRRLHGQAYASTLSEPERYNRPVVFGEIIAKWFVGRLADEPDVVFAYTVRAVTEGLFEHFSRDLFEEDALPVTAGYDMRCAALLEPIRVAIKHEHVRAACALIRALPKHALPTCVQLMIDVVTGQFVRPGADEILYRLVRVPDSDPDGIAPRVWSWHNGFFGPIFSAFLPGQQATGSLYVFDLLSYAITSERWEMAWTVERILRAHVLPLASPAIKCVPPEVRNLYAGYGMALPESLQRLAYQITPLRALMIRAGDTPAGISKDSGTLAGLFRSLTDDVFEERPSWGGVDTWLACYADAHKWSRQRRVEFLARVSRFFRVPLKAFEWSDFRDDDTTKHRTRDPCIWHDRRMGRFCLITRANGTKLDTMHIVRQAFHALNILYPTALVDVYGDPAPSWSKRQGRATWLTSLPVAAASLWDERSLDDYVEMTLQRTIDDRSADDAGFVEDIRLESANRQYVSGLGFGPTYSQTFPVALHLYDFEQVFVQESEHRRVRIIEDGGFELHRPLDTPSFARIIDRFCVRPVIRFMSLLHVLHRCLQRLHPELTQAFLYYYVEVIARENWFLRHHVRRVEPLWPRRMLALLRDPGTFWQSLPEYRLIVFRMFEAQAAVTEPIRKRMAAENAADPDGPPVSDDMLFVMQHHPSSV